MVLSLEIRTKYGSEFDYVLSPENLIGVVGSLGW